MSIWLLARRGSSTAAVRLLSVDRHIAVQVRHGGFGSGRPAKLGFQSSIEISRQLCNEHVPEDRYKRGRYNQQKHECGNGCEDAEDQEQEQERSGNRKREDWVDVITLDGRI